MDDRAIQAIKFLRELYPDVEYLALWTGSGYPYFVARNPDAEAGLIIKETEDNQE